MGTIDRGGARHQCMLLGLVAMLIAGVAVHAVAGDTRLPAAIRFEAAADPVESFEEFVRQLFVLQLDAIGVTVGQPEQARIAIVVAYVVVGDTVEFTLSIVDDDDGRIIGSTEASAPIDLQLDRTLTERLVALFQTERVAVDSIRADETARADAQRREAERVADPEPEDQPEPDAESVARAPAARAPSDPPRTAVRSEAAGFPRFEAATGAAPIVPAGRASEFFGVGYGAVARLTYRVPLAAGAVGVGLSIAPIRFVRTEPELGSFFRYVVPVTVEARYSYAEGRRIEGFVRLGIGASYRISDSSVAVERLSVVLPSAVGGAGLSVRVAHRTQIAIDIGSTAIINLFRRDEQIAAETIIAIVPSLQLSRRF